MSFVKAGIAIAATLSAGMLTAGIVRMQQPPEPAATNHVIEPLRAEPVRVTPIVEPEASDVLVLPAVEIVGVRPVQRSASKVAATAPVELCAAPWRELDSGPAGRRARTLVPCDQLDSEQRSLAPTMKVVSKVR